MLRWFINFGFKVVTVIVIILTVAWELPAAICWLSGPAIGPAPVTQVNIQKDQMIIQGNINADLATQLHNLLNRDHDKSMS